MIVLAQSGRFAEAVDTLHFQTPLFHLDRFLFILAEWISAFEKAELGLSLSVLREATCIIGWVHPDGRKELQISSSVNTF